MRIPDHDPTDLEDPFAPTRMPLGDHIEELRRHLLRALAGLVVAAVVGFYVSEPVLKFIDAPWCDGAVWSLNPNPALPGTPNGATVHWSDAIRQQRYGPAAKGQLDGEYLDSLEGYVTSNLNFRRAHFRYTTVPLTFAVVIWWVVRRIRSRHVSDDSGSDL